jgi:hypothetical protein
VSLRFVSLPFFAGVAPFAVAFVSFFFRESLFLRPAILIELLDSNRKPVALTNSQMHAHKNKRVPGTRYPGRARALLLLMLMLWRAHKIKAFYFIS